MMARKSMRGLGIMAAALLLPGTMRSQACRDTAGFVRLHGKDTLVIEATRFSPGLVTGDMYLVPERTLAHYAADISRYPTETVLTLDLWAAGSDMQGPPTQMGKLLLHSDSALFVVRQGAMAQIQRNRSTPGAIPAFRLAVGLEELIMRRARAMKDTIAAVPTFFVATDGWVPTARIQFIGADSATLQLDEARSRLRVDSTGRILGGVTAPPAGEKEPIRVIRLSCDQAAALMPMVRRSRRAAESDPTPLAPRPASSAPRTRPPATRTPAA